jgi:hypothetical protein
MKKKFILRKRFFLVAIFYSLIITIGLLPNVLYAQVINPFLQSYDCLKISGFFSIPEQSDYKGPYNEIKKLENGPKGCLWQDPALSE